jgi:hypothetical protein
MTEAGEVRSPQPQFRAFATGAVTLTMRNEQALEGAVHSPG